MKQKGITLIALVITIIVLIILAGVSINLLLGDNGLIVRARAAKEISRAASVQDERDIWKLSKEVNEYEPGTSAESLTDLVERLVNDGLLTEDEKDQILGNEEKGIEAAGEVTIGGKTIVFGKEAKTLVQAFIDGDIEVGTYLEYDPIENTTTYVEQAETGVSGTQTYTVDTSTTWRVLGLNEAGTELLITSGSPIKKDGNDPYLHLASVEGYTYCIDTLDKISRIYHNSKYASRTRSMTMKDVELALGITVDETENKAYKTADEEKTALAGFQHYFGESYTYATGDYAPENYLGTGSVRVGEKVDGSAYVLIATNSTVVDPASPIYDVIFSGTMEADNYAKSYWLASPGNIVSSFGAGFGLGVVHGGHASAGWYRVFHSSGGFTEDAFGVRPVVSLWSHITVEDVKPTTGEETEWTSSAGVINSGSVTKGQVLEEESSGNQGVM